MKIYELPKNSDLRLQFWYKDREFNVKVKALKVAEDKVYVPAIKDRDKLIVKDDMKNIRVQYCTDQGVYDFEDVSIGLAKCKDKHLFILRSDFDAQRKK